jgi:hypothetical protein
MLLLLSLLGLLLLLLLLLPLPLLLLRLLLLGLPCAHARLAVRAHQRPGMRRRSHPPAMLLLLL